MDIHGKVDDPRVKNTLGFIAGEEKKPKAFLVNYCDGNFGEKSMRISEVVDNKIADLNAFLPLYIGIKHIFHGWKK